VSIESCHFHKLKYKQRSAKAKLNKSKDLKNANNAEIEEIKGQNLEEEEEE